MDWPGGWGVVKHAAVRTAITRSGGLSPRDLSNAALSGR